MPNLPVHEVARGAPPPRATVLVVSQGDDALLDLPGRQIWRFPQRGDGFGNGHDPDDGEVAVAHLEELRVAGAAYLLVPADALSWLEHYPRLCAHLDRTYRRVLLGDRAAIYQLTERID